MDIRPQDLPELRAGLFDGNTSRDAAEFWDEHARLEYYRNLKGTGPELQRIAASALSGDLYFVSAQMATLAATAGESLPLFGVELEDLPSKSGLMIFERTPDLLTGPDDHHSAQNEVIINGMAWTSIEGGFWLIPVAQPCDGAAPTLGGPVVMPFIGEDELPPVTRSKVLMDYAITTLRSAWLLMQQPLTEQSEVSPDRAVRKRLRRAGHEPASVRVIELRRPKSSGEHGDGTRTYHHQWITRGHWRQQWYATRQVHRPVWIAPHVKGPEGAPMIGGEKVYAWKR